MKEKENLNIKKIIIIALVVLIVAIIIVVIFFTIRKKDSNKLKENVNIDMEAEAIIYYKFDYTEKAILSEDNNVFSSDTTITWPESCTGVIKKDGKNFSTENGTYLIEDGTYEITVTTPKKNSQKKSLIIDKKPPEVEIEESSDNVTKILFKDVNDVKTAILYKIDDETGKFVQLLDLKEDGLKESFEVKEKGYYLIRCTDNVENVNSKEFELTGK